MKLTINPDFIYRTLLASAQHVSADDWATLARLSETAFYVHQTASMEPGYIVRFNAVGANDADDIRTQLETDGFTADFIDLLAGINDAELHAVHFDLDMDLIAGAPWYLDSGSKVTPLAYDLPLLYWHELDGAQQDAAEADYLPAGETAHEYFEDGDHQFIVLPASDNSDAQVYCMADCMRLSDSDEADYFDGAFSESAFSSVLVKLSDDSETVNLARLTN